MRSEAVQELDRQRRQEALIKQSQAAVYGAQALVSIARSLDSIAQSLAAKVETRTSAEGVGSDG